MEIYEYTPGFVHAKVFTCDDERAVVGTINLDYRSLYLHFECATYIWKNPVINDIELDFYNTLENASGSIWKTVRNTIRSPKVTGRSCAW